MAFRQIAGAASCLVALLAALPSTALANDAAMKNAAVLGGLVSYGYAYFQKDKIDCRQRFGVGAQYGEDDELENRAVSVSFMDCAIQQPALGGWNFRIEPTLLASTWSADENRLLAGAADSATEVTLVPRVFYVRPVGGVKLDVMFGIGVSYLSEATIGLREKSTNFQFSDEIGLGISNASETIRLGLSYRHISNANIKSPNYGVDFRGLTLNFRLP